ncbi:hypothetical protein [Xanthobacter agilis]|jgi:hypothetical protein
MLARKSARNIPVIAISPAMKVPTSKNSRIFNEIDPTADHPDLNRLIGLIYDEGAPKCIDGKTPISAISKI